MAEEEQLEIAIENAVGIGNVAGLFGKDLEKAKQIFRNVVYVCGHRIRDPWGGIMVFEGMELGGGWLKDAPSEDKGASKISPYRNVSNYRSYNVRDNEASVFKAHLEYYWDIPKSIGGHPIPEGTYAYPCRLGIVHFDEERFPIKKLDKLVEKLRKVDRICSGIEFND